MGNDISEYLRTRVGSRFLILRDKDYVRFIDILFPSVIIMCNDQFEKDGVRELLAMAKGKVLIGGLGIGLIVEPLMNKPEVESIDIVELHQEVIDLVAPQLDLNDKVNIIHDNIYTFVPEHKYDTIFIDTIEPYVCTPEERESRGEYKEDRELVNRYYQYLNQDGYCSYFK